MTQWGSIESNGIVAKALYLMSERRFIQPDNPLNTVSRRKIGLFIGIQIFGVACTVAISQTIAAIGFPVLITALIPLRVFLMPRWFSKQELGVLDNLTADNPTVLVSFGGTPAGMKDDVRLEKRGADDLGVERGHNGDAERRDSTDSRRSSAVHQHVGGIHR